MSEPMQVTIVAKSGGPSTKRISPAADDSLISEGSACVMSRGTAIGSTELERLRANNRPPRKPAARGVRRQPRQHYAGHLYDAALDDWRLYYQRKYRRRLRRQYRLSRGEGKRLRAAWTPEDFRSFTASLRPEQLRAQPKPVGRARPRCRRAHRESAAAPSSRAAPQAGDRIPEAAGPWLQFPLFEGQSMQPLDPALFARLETSPARPLLAPAEQMYILVVLAWRGPSNFAVNRIDHVSSKAVMRHGENPRAYGDLWLGGAIPVCVLLVRVGWSRWRIIADAVDPERWRTRGTT